jgi:hypothetical protein
MPALRPENGFLQPVVAPEHLVSDPEVRCSKHSETRSFLRPLAQGRLDRIGSSPFEPRVGRVGHFGQRFPDQVRVGNVAAPAEARA